MYTFMWGSIVAEDSLFQDCWAGDCEYCHAGDKAGHGGAIFTDRGTLTVRRCDFVNNAQAIWAWSVKGKDSSQAVTIADSTFTNNHANGSGAALANQWSLFEVSNTTFVGNAATKGGGVLYDDTRSTTVFVDSTFSDDNTGHENAVSVVLSKGNTSVGGGTFRVKSAEEGSPAKVHEAFAGCSVHNLKVQVIKTDDTKSGFVQKDFVISMFIEPQPTLHNYKLIQQANFTTVLQEHAVGNASARATSIKLCEQLGLNVIAKNEWGPMPKSDAVLGVYLRDEPPLSEFAELAHHVSDVRRTHPSWLSFINLYPWYPSGPAAVPHIGCSSYAEYLDKFLRIVDPDIICFDVRARTFLN